MEAPLAMASAKTPRERAPERSWRGSVCRQGSVGRSGWLRYRPQEGSGWYLLDLLPLPTLGGTARPLAPRARGLCIWVEPTDSDVDGL